MRLSDYIDDTKLILHDASFLFTSENALIRWINRSRHQVAMRTGCVERLIMGQSAFGGGAQPGTAIPSAADPDALPGAIPNTGPQTQNGFYTIPGVERYPYQDFANGYLTQQHAGIEGIIDTISVSVNWGGSPRPSLAWMPFADLQAYARSYANLVESYPYFWSTFNDGSNGEVWLFPVPSFPNEMEWQVICRPKAIYSNDDFCALPENFANAVKYYAAGLAFMASQRFGPAQIMFQLFDQHLGIGRASSDSGKVPNFYYSEF